MIVRRLFARILLCAGLAVGLRAAASADELADRQQIIADVSALLKAERFADLEAMAEGFRSSKARTSSGLWKLTLFYGGLESAFDGKNARDAQWTESERLMKAWLHAHPDSSTAQVGYGTMLVARAWGIRGSGYADTVAPEKWPPFRKTLAEAHAYLNDHKTTASVDPQWYTAMAKVANLLSLPEEEFDAVFEEGSAREPYYYQLYFEALQHYLPKWGGNSAAVERFARRAMELTSSTDGYGVYARVYWSASGSQFHDNLFHGSNVNWIDMKKGIDDVLAQYPDAWNINNFAKLACYAGDSVKMMELINRIEGEPIRAVWPKEHMDACRTWARQHPEGDPSVPH
jgi:hypothetical protein